MFELNAERQQLFADHEWIAYREARCFLKRNGRFHPRDDVRNVALEGLFRAAAQFDFQIGGNFGAFATQRIRWRLNQYFFCCERGAPSSKASRDAIAFETQASEPVKLARDDSEKVTTMDLAIDQAGGRELGRTPGLEHMSSVLTEAWALKDLTTREHCILLLRFDAGLEITEIAEAIGVSNPVVKRDLKIAIVKLRAFFQAKGFKTVPLNSPVLNAGNRLPAIHRPAAV